MDYRILGRTGVKVSPLCFGTMSFGDIADKAESARMFNRCREVGINFFDCANTYAGGRSEEILGDLIEDCRDDIVLTTKVVSRTGPDVNQGGASRRHMQISVEQSLKRLKTDRIDVFFLHHYDADMPIEEMLRALDDLVRQGKILYPAVSNWSAWQVMKAQGIARYEGLARIECLQPMYNLVKRQAEVEILPLAQEEQIGVIPYSPLGGGLLTGKYTREAGPESGRLIENAMYIKRYGVSDYYQTAADFTLHAGERDLHPATLAVAWVMAHPGVTAPIIGARNLSQLEASLAALNVEMTEEWYEQISSLSSTPPPAHDRLDEVD